MDDNDGVGGTAGQGRSQEDVKKLCGVKRMAGLNRPVGVKMFSGTPAPTPATVSPCATVWRWPIGLGSWQRCRVSWGLPPASDTVRKCTNRRTIMKLDIPLHTVAP